MSIAIMMICSVITLSAKGTQETLDKITKYVKTNPMAGYHIHIYSNPDGGNEVESK